MTSVFTIDRFAVGDRAVFERSFSPADFDAFAKLSGDKNPLHHDQSYAAGQRFGKTIVPLHLSMAPLSMIAGMVFPGEPSLYLGHEIVAALPVFYGDVLRYSVRVTAVNTARRVLSLRVLALRKTDVVLDATMRVQAHTTQWSTSPALPVISAQAPRLALVTGAAGEIGGATAVALARRGYRLLLQVRNEDQRSQALAQRLAQAGAQTEFVSADLTTAKGASVLANAIAGRDDLALLVHAASPKVTDGLDALVAVNFAALKTMTDAALPNLLARQDGAVILVGSLATERALAGWEDYSAAKSMAGNLVAALDRRMSPYGVRGLTVMPGLVATEFSRAYHGEAGMLLPQEVAEAVADAAAHGGAGNVFFLEADRAEWGSTGFHLPVTAVEPVTARPSAVAGAAADQAGEGVVAAIVRKSFRLGDNADLSQAGLGQTAGWDSLRHMTLLLDIEAALGVRFTSVEIEGAQSYRNLASLVIRKQAERGHG